MVKTDAIIGVLGVLLSLTLFVAQGPYEHWSAYAVGFSPAFAAVIWLLAAYIGRKYQELKYALIVARESRLTMSTVVRVENAAGDVTMERRRRITSLSGATRIKHTPEEGVFSTNKGDSLPPIAHVLGSREPGRRLSIRGAFENQVMVQNEKAWEYRWSYHIDPPLRGKGDYVEYEYSVQLPGGEADAFTAVGGLFVAENTYFGASTDVSIIAPAGYDFELMEAWLEDFDGQKLQLDERERPKLSVKRHELTWQPVWRKGTRHGCRFRFLPVARSA